ncbi:hypothetical protein ZOD2009_01750 [Haladaptatus paucihalophilus DX253]|uniref:Uncharacterized protein n=1 Tax=Haladaptatus paucihalophilus DX253 TaxID=797209 RepID=E7QN32_HALPU|nr:hypothetical protein ZOD2009_01750 [Haladaptatus paucihalophilus DX253]
MPNDPKAFTCQRKYRTRSPVRTAWCHEITTIPDTDFETENF